MKLHSVPSFDNNMPRNKINIKQNFLLIFFGRYATYRARACALALASKLGKKIPVWKRESHGKVSRGVRSKDAQLFSPRGCKQEIFHGIKPAWDKRERSSTQRPLVCIWKCNILSKFTRERYNLRQRSWEKKLLQWPRHHRGCRENSIKWRKMSAGQLVKKSAQLTN